MTQVTSNVRGLSALAVAFCETPVGRRRGGPQFSAVPIAIDDTGGEPLIGRQHGDAAAFAILEPLEARQLMSVSLNGAGFTVVTPAADSRVIYVSSSGGSDANSGLSTSSPVKSLAKGMSLVRTGSADQLLLKRGDSWKEAFGRWTKSGRSASEPLVIGAYGSGDRPLIRSGTSDGIGLGSASVASVNHLAILGLHFWADGRDPSVPGYNRYSLSYGINVIAGGTGLLIEDVKVEKYMTNIAFVPYLGDMQNVTIRRSIITDAYDVGNSSLHAQGLFVDGVRGLTLEQNTFDHNGWHDTIPGAKATIYNHNAYVTGDTSGLVAKGNLFANASSHGLQARAGGVITGNLFLNNPIGLSYGLVNGGGVNVKGGVSGEVSDNIFLGGRDISGSGRGIGIQAGNIRPGSGTHFSRNIFTSYQDGGLAAIVLEYGVGTTQGDAVGINDLTIKDNIVHKWYRGLSVASDMSTTAISYKRLKNVVLKNNRFSELSRSPLLSTDYLAVDATSSITSDASRYPAPERSLATFNKALGGYTAEWQFMVQLRDRGLGVWNPAYSALAPVDFIRAGFGYLPLNASQPTPPASPPATVPPAVPPTVPPVVPPTVPPSVPPAVPPAVPPTVPPTTGQEPIRKSDAAVYVKSVKLCQIRDGQKLIVRFSRDVGATIDLADLTLTTEGGQAISTSQMTLEWNARKRMAVWRLGGELTPPLDRGVYNLGLNAQTIVDDKGRHLDGDRDRQGGDNFNCLFKVKKKAA